jgi:hypothetical protein
MEINVKFVCPEVLGTMKNGRYAVPEGATILELLCACQEKNNFHVEEEQKKSLLLLADGKRADWDTVLREDSQVLFLRRALGG